MINPYSPAASGETADQLWWERSDLDGTTLGAVAYGMHVMVAGATIHALLYKSPSASARNIPWAFIIYVFLLFVCGTLNLASATRVAELTWIDNRGYPGGPYSYGVQMYNIAANVMGNAAYITGNFLADGLLIWRCFLVYNRNWFVIIIPGLAYMASTALSVLTIYQSSQPSASIWSHSAVVVAVPYWSLSISLNVTVTLLIVARILWMRRSVQNSLGTMHGKVYLGIATMMIESAALYSTVGLIYIIAFARNSNLQNLVIGVLTQAMCVAPELIILRVATGRSWDSTVPSATSRSLRFGSNSLFRAAHPIEISVRKDRSGTSLEDHFNSKSVAADSENTFSV